jgi:hypothetical protein
MMLDTEARQGVIILSNISSGHSHSSAIDRLGFFLMKTITNMENEPRPVSND